MGCAGRVANGINTVHLSYVREKTGHALAGARQWIPAEDIADPVKSLVTGLPLDLRFRTKGQLAIDILGDAYADGLAFDFACGDEVYGSCTELREFLEDRGQAYVLRVASSFMLTLAAGTKMTCADAVKKLLKGKQGWEVRSAGEGIQGRALVRLGLDRHRLPAAQPAGPPPPEDRRAGLPLLLRARRAGRVQGPADQGSGPALAGGGELRARARAASAWTSARPGSTPRSCGTSCWSWPPSRSAPSPPPSSGPHRRPGTAARQAGRHAARRPRADPAHRPRGQAPARRRPPTARSRPATPPAGSTGDAATRHDPAGSTNAHAWHATTPWSASDWRLPYCVDYSTIRLLDQLEPW